MSGPAAPAVATLVTLVVVVAGLTGIIDAGFKAYAGLLLVLLGLAALAWGREGEE